MTLVGTNLQGTKMTYETEPDECENCESTEPMRYEPVEVDGVPAIGWICDECSFFHEENPTKSRSTVAIHRVPKACPL
jgi:hypothetical protein